jgi:hypothetical protein
MDIYNGLIKKNILENSLKTSVMARESLNGKMEESMKEAGSEANSMEMVFIEMLRVFKKKATGLMEKEQSGLNNDELISSTSAHITYINIYHICFLNINISDYLNR